MGGSWRESAGCRNFANEFANGSLPRRALADMPPWEQSLKRAGSNGKPGWSARGVDGRVMVEARVPGQPKQSVLLPPELAWSEADEQNVIIWLAKLWEATEAGKVHLRPALDSLIVRSDQIGEQHAPTWLAIREAFRQRLMESGNQIRLSTWESNYLPYIDEALLAIKNHKLTDGPSALRHAVKRWQQYRTSRGVCVSTLKGFFEFAVRDARFKLPESWLIPEFDAAPIRGNQRSSAETAALSDLELIELLDAVETRWGKGWRNVVSVFVALGIRPVELGLISLQKNDVGEWQMRSSYQKSGGKNKTRPRWLFEIPLIDADGNEVAFNIAETWKTMEWPKSRNGERRLINAHYLEKALKAVPYWMQLRAEYEPLDLRVRPYSMRNSWNVRAKRLGLPDAVVSSAAGNSVATNLRSYRQTTDLTTREAFQRALGR